MKLWLLLCLAFIVQEPISASAVLIEAYQSHYNVWVIHALFCALTLLDIVVTYLIGDYVKKKYATMRWVGRIEAKAADFAASIGRFGKVATLVFFAPLAFPLTGLIIPWLGIGLGETIIYTFIGETIFWYGYIWLLVLGVNGAAEGSHAALYVIVAVSLAMTVGFGYMRRKMRNN